MISIFNAVTVDLVAVLTLVGAVIYTAGRHINAARNLATTVSKLTHAVDRLSATVARLEEHSRLTNGRIDRLERRMDAMTIADR